MQNQLLLSIVAIGVAAAGMGVGTYAFFSDEATSTGNDFDAATVDLHVSDGDEGSSEAVVATYAHGNMLPGEGGTATLTLINDGSRGDPDLDIDIKFTQTSDTDGCDAGVHIACPNGPVLDSNLEVTVEYDGVDVTAAGECLAGAVIVTFADLFAAGPCNDNSAGAAGSSHTLKITWDLPAATGNDAQGDGFTFDVAAALEQAADADY